VRDEDAINCRSSWMTEELGEFRDEIREFRTRTSKYVKTFIGSAVVNYHRDVFRYFFRAFRRTDLVSGGDRNPAARNGTMCNMTASTSPGSHCPSVSDWIRPESAIV
jgi:hypothetical protein